MIQPGRRLDADGVDAVGEPEAPLQRRLAVTGPEPPPAAAAGRVDERRVHTGQVGVPDVGLHGLHVLGSVVRTGVGHGHAQVQRLQIHGPDRPARRQGDQVAADAAAQVG